MKRAAMGASGLDVQSRRATASESGKRGRRRGEQPGRRENGQSRARRRKRGGEEGRPPGGEAGRGEGRGSRVDGCKAQEGNAAKATMEAHPKSAENAAEAASNGVLGSKASPSTDGEESKELQLPDRRVHPRKGGREGGGDGDRGGERGGKRPIASIASAG